MCRLNLSLPEKVQPYEYLNGRESTEKLKEVTGFELIIREHLKSGHQLDT